MKDSGFEWLNNIPASWVTKPVYAVASVSKISFDPKTKPNTTFCEFSMPAFDKGCKPALVKGNAMESARIALTKPVVLMNKLNVRKQRVWNIKEVPDDALCTSEFVPLEVKEGVSQDYVYWCLLNKSSADNLDALSNGSSNSQIRVRPNDINHLRIALPPTADEQQSIADYLTKKCSEFERAAQLIDEQIGYLSRYRTSVIHEAVTRGLDPTTSTKNSGINGIGTIPESWVLRKLKHVLSTFESGTSVRAANYPADKGEKGVLSLSAVFGGRYNPRANKRIDDDELVRASCYVKTGCLLVSRCNTSELVGLPAYVENGSRDLYLPDKLWQLDSGHIDINRFIYYAMQSKHAREYCAAMSVGSSESMQNIASFDLLNMYVALPSEPEEAKQIADYLDARTAAIDAVLDTKRKQLDILKRRRQSLIYEYVTGKRRVTEEA